MKTNLERFFSSFVTTIVLLLIYAFGLAVATFIEKYHGTATAKAMVYYSPLFFLLQFLLVVNFIAATIKHQYLKRGKWGLMLTHFAFIVILLGALTSFLFGEEGILHLREGETSNQIAVRTSDNTTFHTLPFSVELKKFTLTRYPGSASPSSYESEVIVHVDGEDREERIFMNNVLDVKGYRFFQASYDQDEHGTILSVNRDVAGRNITYTGYLLLVIGLGWGFGFAPADYQQGESYRIMYLHVPAAMWSMGLYLAMAVAAFIGVVWQIKMADLAIAALAPVGAVCTLVALVSGAAWGKPMWGTWWIWDARLTSELVLLFLYAGVIALWHAFDDRRLAGRAAGILVLVGVVNLPIIHYSVYWWNTLHQGSTNLQQTIDPSMRLPLRICIFAFLMLSVTLTLMRLRNLILQLEHRRPWVVALVNKGAAR